MNTNAPILEFDPDPQAILSPPIIESPDFPRHVVICFFQDVISELAAAGRLTRRTALRSEIGEHVLYDLAGTARPQLVFHPGISAPLGVGLLEEVIGLGGRHFIVCGGAGVLEVGLDVGHLYVLDSAVRDEGTSYHYLPPSREVAANPRATQALLDVLAAHHVPHHPAKAWTTDAFYRETAAKRARRVAEGCQVVEMEAAAFFAVAQFRQVELGEMVYGGDVVVPEGWDSRSWTTRADIRRNLLELAVEACQKL